MMREPMCWACGVEMRPLKNGVTIVEMASFGPAALWQADLMECPECHTQVVVGLGSKPWSQHFKPDFTTRLSEVKDDEWTREVWLNAGERVRYETESCVRPE